MRRQVAAVWGDQGYMHLKRGVNAPDGLCGVNMQPTYPIAKAAPATNTATTHGHQPTASKTCSESLWFRRVSDKSSEEEQLLTFRKETD